jgi:hypothetical protein
MRAKAALKELHRPEPTLEQEFDSLGDDDLMDFMNLTEEETGIVGTIFVSTAMGPHGPRVKYFLKSGKDQKSFSVAISTEPYVMASSLPDRITNRTAPAVIEWVRLNRSALLKFWNEGKYWSRAEVNAFADRLKKRPAD